MNVGKEVKSKLVSNYLWERSKPVQGCVTILMSSEGGGKEQAKHARRLRRVLQARKEKWEQEGSLPSGGRAILKQGEALAGESEIWKGDYEGVCIHLSDTDYGLLKLPSAPENKVWEGHRFRFRPASEALTSPWELLALGLDSSGARLFRYDGEAAIHYRSFQLSESLPASSGIDPERQGSSDRTDPFDACLRDVALALSHLDDAHRLPLLLIGSGDLPARAEKYCQHPQGEIYSMQVSKVPVDGEGIAGVCGAFCQRAHDEAIRDGIEKLEDEQASRASGFTSDVAEIVQAAESGRVALCAIDREAEVWLKRVGFDELREAEPGEGPEAFEALDCIFAEGVQKGAATLVVDAERVPGGGPVAALVD